MAKDSKIEWTNHTGNLWWGCTKVHAGCDNCLHPYTRVMIADGSWKQISNVSVGESLLGFTDVGTIGTNRTISISKVEAVWPTVNTTIEIRTQSGKRVVSSPNHLFLVKSGNRTTWKRADELHIGSKILSYSEPSIAANTENHDYMAGYITGVFDGDGTMRFNPEWRSDKKGFPQMYWRVAVLKSDGAMIDRLQRYLAHFEIVVNQRPFSGSKTGAAAKPMIKVEARSKPVIASIAEVMKERTSNDWKAGWLAGFLDTDGFCSGSQRSNGVVHRWSQVYTRNGHLDRTLQYIADLGFRATLERSEKRPTSGVVLNVDTIEERVRFISTIAPALFRKGIEKVYGSRYVGILDSVTALICGSETELIDIQTSTGTFIAEGLSTHNCYAEGVAKHRGHQVWGDNAQRRATKSVWNDFYKWNALAHAAGEVHKVFVGSMMDIFERSKYLSTWQGEPLLDKEGDAVTMDALRHRFFTEVIPACQNLDFLLLTKRPSNINKMIPHEWVNNPPANVMFGTSPVDQKTFDTLVPQLQKVKGRKFLSIEPQLGPIAPTMTKLEGIDWVIQGGESGPNRRPFKLDWAYFMRDVCELLRVPYFFKQIDKVKEIPPDLQVRQFPGHYQNQ